MSVKPEGHLRDIKKTNVLYHPVQAKNLNLNSYNINQICHTILHPNQLVTILKLFILLITGLLERPVSGTLAHNMMLILELHHTNDDKLR